MADEKNGYVTLKTLIIVILSAIGSIITITFQYVEMRAARMEGVQQAQKERIERLEADIKDLETIISKATGTDSEQNATIRALMEKIGAVEKRIDRNEARQKDK